MTGAAVRAAWVTSIANNSQIIAITPNFYDYDITAAINSKTELRKLYDNNNKINFFKLIVSRQSKDAEVRATSSTSSLYEYDLEIVYYLEKDISETSWNANIASDRIELVDQLVRSQLGKRWSNTVNFWQMSGFLSTRLIDLDGKAVWQVGYSYAASSYE